MPAVSGSRWIETAGWDDVPHLPAKWKAEELAETPVHLRDARSKGIPSLGSGAIYPFLPETFVIPPFQIPPYFRRGYGMDVGWKVTAAMFGAYDQDQDILYFIGEHYRSEAEAPVHAAAIKARASNWMPGFIDPASQGSSQVDGRKLIDLYKEAGLKLSFADNAVEAGIMEIHQRLGTGRLKVFSTCVKWLDEFLFYQRDEKGKIVKRDDHCQDAGRYLALKISSMIVKPLPRNVTRQVVGDREAGY